MNTRLTANLSIFFTCVSILLSFSFGFHKYSETKTLIISDLNQALQQTLLQNGQAWMSPDTIKSYIHLSRLFGNPLTIESYNTDFSKMLVLPEIKGISGIRVCVKNKKKTLLPPPETNSDLTIPYLTSDTVLWFSAPAGLSAGSMQNDIGISFQGYAKCSFRTILSMTDKTWPGLFLFFGLLSGFFSFYLIGRRKTANPPGPVSPENAIVYGNLTLLCDEATFYRDNREKLKLTPQQYTLMEMFFLSPTRILTRTEICDVFWPGKVNADETLNTLMRRLRGLIESQTNLKITTDRGRAYILEIGEEQAS